ncbi:MAG: N-acetylmuramic acid 6-phosphate etherase [Alphaproteobacteria bacterium]|nr:N-acetylmuramic acid 6-phosphate etherase [Alphaproteobacteria bacterium]
MDTPQTECMHEHAEGIDLRAPDAIVSTLLDGQADAVKSVRQAIPDIVTASDITADTVRQGGKLVYAAAGSSGLMALSDALELPGTFGIPRDRIRILFAGGLPGLDTFFGGPEDDEGLGIRDVDDNAVSKGDCLIAVSASGSTPYAVGALQRASEHGAHTIAIANNADSPLLRASDTPIYLPTPPELVAGSTRMGAGTAQKIALNIMSTLMAVQLGHVVDGHMVNLVADNTKLQARATRMVMALAGCGEQTARDCLATADGAVKVAILLAGGAPDVSSARQRLEHHHQNVRSALAALDQDDGPEQQRA